MASERQKGRRTLAAAAAAASVGTLLTPADAWVPSVRQPAVASARSTADLRRGVSRPAQSAPGALAPAASVLALCATVAAALRRRRRVTLAVLPDGTNEEGEDIKEPLGMTRKDLKRVVLYGQEASPPCVKLKTMLDYYQVPFEMVKGRHPTSDYKKIPVMELNDRQVNDSHIIVKSLVPVLTGKPLTEQDLEWERRITFEFQPSFEVELFGNGRDLAKFVGAEGWTWLASLLAGPLSALVGNLFRDRYGDFPPAAAWGKDFREALGERRFYHGDAPGPVDLSLYGTYVKFEEKGCETSAAFLDGAGLRQWHERMAEAMKVGLSADEVAA